MELYYEKRHRNRTHRYSWLCRSRFGHGKPHVDAAQETLETYDFDVDASKLSSAQVSSLALLSVDSDIQHPGRAEARAKNSIRAILK
jgi:hypothetical protein